MMSSRFTLGFLSAFAGLAVGAPTPAHTAVVESTTAGGLWHVESTWVGDVVPEVEDDVIVTGPVTLANDEGCGSLDVSSSGSVDIVPGPPIALNVTGLVRNAGVVTDESGFRLTLNAGGSVENDGSWEIWETVLAGTSDRAISSSTPFHSHVGDSDEVGGTLTLANPLSVIGNIALDDVDIHLTEDASLSLAGGSFNADVFADGRELIFTPSTYLAGGRIDDAVLIGDVTYGFGTTFTNGVTVQDGLRNSPAIGQAHLVIEGTLVNNGLIRNDTYGLTISLAGNLVCNGSFTNSHLSFEGASPYQLSMGPSGELDTGVFLPEFQSGESIEFLTDVRLIDGLSLGTAGTLLLESDLVMDGGSILGGTVFTNNHVIRQEGDPANFNATEIDQANLEGEFVVSGDVRILGLHLDGTLSNAEFSDSDLDVIDLVNLGWVKDRGSKQLNMRVTGNVINTGVIENARVDVDGLVDQSIAIGDGIDAAVTSFIPDFTAASYQWFLNGTPIPGATSRTLEFVTLAVDHVGAYWCEDDGGTRSRTITVEQGVVAVESPITTPGLVRSVMPNPLLRSTVITFAQTTRGPVTGRIFDVTGRVRAVVLDEVLSAGDHAVTWRPNSLAPGVYFLRLDAGSKRDVRKLTILD